MATPTPTTLTVDDPHAGHDHGGDGHAHEAPMLVGHDGQLHPSNLQHFFVSSEQQFEASKLGMWLFLATEILLFGGMEGDRFSGQDLDGDGMADLPRLTSDGVSLTAANISASFPYMGAPE